jgi:glycosyltransferase involved in cell wall biosynthesis
MNKKADKVQKKALEKCFAVVTPCDWVKDSIANDYHVDTTKVHVIESGANLEKIPPVYERIWSKEKFRMLFIGIDTKRKGVDVAIETAHILNEKYGINAMLTIVGGEISKELKQKKYIDWVGFLDKNNPKESRYFEQLIKESHLFIFPTMAECAGIVNCEASAYGLPILSYDTGGVGNYVINGVNGYRLPLTAKGEDFAKKIVKMFEANEFLKLSDGGRKLYEEKFNWETWGEKYHEEIEKLLK